MTVEYKLFRFSSGVESTLGLLHLQLDEGWQFKCFTLEDQHNEPKIPKETRIPAGRYEIKLRKVESPLTKKYRSKYPWFTWHLWLHDVPGFEFVYIHIGNTDDHTDGCILVGDGALSNANEENGSVPSSRPAFRRLYDEILSAFDEGEQVFITIEDYA